MDIRERQSMLLCLDTKFHFSSLAVGHFLRLKPLQNGSKRDMGKQNLSGSGYGPVAGACEHSDESLRFHRKQEISCVAYGLILKASDDGVGWYTWILLYSSELCKCYSNLKDFLFKGHKHGMYFHIQPHFSYNLQITAHHQSSLIFLFRPITLGSWHTVATPFSFSTFTYCWCCQGLEIILVVMICNTRIYTFIIFHHAQFEW